MTRTSYCDNLIPRRSANSRWIGRRYRSCARLFVLLSWVAVMFSASLSWADIVRQEVSRPRPNEIDTADRGGQIGGIKLGRGYKLIDLRCGAGEAIVGLRTRRGSVLDYIQIDCARPVCDGRGCQWSSSLPGRSAGNAGGGDAQPPMSCNRNEMLSGVRGRTVTFTVFDYAADLEIECTPIASPPSTDGSVAVGKGGSAAGIFGSTGSPSDGSRGITRSEFVSCARDYGFGATAVSVGESDFVRRGQRVVQALSLYCPKGTRSTTPSNALKMVEAMDRCLREESQVVYYASPNKRAYSGSVAYNNSTISYDATYLDRQPPYLRAYQLADAFASHVLDLQQQRYPVQNESRGYRTQAADTIVGFLAHCLRSKENLLQKDNKDPRVWFDEHRRVAPGSLREDDFNRGWSLFGAGLPRAITMER